LIIIVIILPKLTKVFALTFSDNLFGVVIPVKTNVDYTFSNYLSGEIQKKIKINLKNKIGARNFLIRAYNQINYSLFKMLSSGVIILSDGTFIKEDDIKSFCGVDYVGFNKLNDFVLKLSYIQKQLKKDNKTLLMVIGADKAGSISELIPKQYDNLKKDSTNYTVLSHLLKMNKINTIDFNKYFNEIKDTLKYPVFYKYGIHWSGYSSTIAADTIYNYISSQLKLPQHKFYSKALVSVSDSIAFTDNDLGELSNLLFPIKERVYYYPKLVFPKNEKKINALIVGDSFAQSFYGFYPYYDSLLTDNSRYWYYNNYLSWPKKDEGLIFSSVNYINEYSNRDIYVIIETLTSFSQNFAYEFVNNLYNFIKFKEIKNNFSLNKLTNKIKKNCELLNGIKLKVISNKISDNLKLKLEAICFFEQNKVYKAIQEETIKEIKRNSLYNLVIKKAENNNISIETQLLFEAHWIIEQEFKIN